MKCKTKNCKNEIKLNLKYEYCHICRFVWNKKTKDYNSKKKIRLIEELDNIINEENTPEKNILYSLDEKSLLDYNNDSLFNYES